MSGRVQGPDGQDAASGKIPFENIGCLFLDLGGTLVSVDYDWVSDELARRGVAAPAQEIERAEAAARPIVSRRLRGLQAREGHEIFRYYLTVVLQGLASGRALTESHLAGLVSELTPVLRAPGESHRLWSRVLPGVREALAAFRRAGLPVVVVSNSDGSAEDILVRQGLRDLVAAVVDSHVIGIEKPDPGIFAHALSLAGARPGETLHVGDFYDLDVVGARNAGLHALLMDPFGDWPDVDCARIASVSELPELVSAD